MRPTCCISRPNPTHGSGWDCRVSPGSRRRRFLTAPRLAAIFLFALIDGADVLPALLQSQDPRRLLSLSKTPKRKKKVSVKEMKYKHDPMIRFYDKTQDWLQDRGRPLV